MKMERGYRKSNINRQAAIRYNKTKLNKEREIMDDTTNIAAIALSGMPLTTPQTAETPNITTAAINAAIPTPPEKPTNIKAIKLPYILAYVKYEGQAAVNWLKEYANMEITRTVEIKPRKSKKAKDDEKQEKKEIETKEIITKPTFIQIRNAFVEKFMPELVPPKKIPEPSMYDIINAL